MDKSTFGAKDEASASSIISSSHSSRGIVGGGNLRVHDSLRDRYKEAYMSGVRHITPKALGGSPMFQEQFYHFA